MTASAARLAASAPMPSHTRTNSSFSKKRKRRPSTSFSLILQSRTNVRTSRSSAATIATLDISVTLEPVHRPPQRALDGNDLPAQFALCLVRAGEHFFLAHPHRIDCGAWLAMQHAPRNRLINHPSSKGKNVWQPYLRRGQPRDFPQRIQNLLERQILT